MRPRIAAYLEGSRITAVAVTARGPASRVTIEAAPDPAAALAAAFSSRGLSGVRLRLGLDRRLVIVKPLELPRAERGDLARMIAFDLGRHVPFPPEATRFAWAALPGAPGGSRRVLIVATEAETVERALGLARAAGRRPAALTVACHALPALLPRRMPRRRTVWAHRHGGVVDLLCLEGRAVLTSRQMPAAGPEDLAREIRRTLTVVRWSAPDAVWLSDGASPESAEWRERLTAALGVSTVTPPLREWVARRAAARPEEDGTGLLALALVAERRRPPLDLLPPTARPWEPSREQMVTAALLALVGAAGIGWGLGRTVAIERYLARVNAEVRRLEPAARESAALASLLADRRRLADALASIERTRVPVLPVLRELTETLPADAWLQSLSMDRHGVELAGQAAAAAGLVPLLEASRRLEGAELTSPVTKSLGKEHFRIRAGWER